MKRSPDGVRQPMDPDMSEAPSALGHPSYMSQYIPFYFKQFEFSFL